MYIQLYNLAQRLDTSFFIAVLFPSSPANRASWFSLLRCALRGTAPHPQVDTSFICFKEIFE